MYFLLLSMLKAESFEETTIIENSCNNIKDFWSIYCIFAKYCRFD